MNFPACVVDPHQLVLWVGALFKVVLSLYVYPSSLSSYLANLVSVCFSCRSRTERSRYPRSKAAAEAVNGAAYAE